MANPSSKIYKFLVWDAFFNCHTPHEESTDSPKRCRIIASKLKNAFADCHTFRARLSYASPEEDHLPCTDFMDEEEVHSGQSQLGFISTKRELFITPNTMQQKNNSVEVVAMQEKSNNFEAAMNDDYSSQLSRCSNVTSIGPFSFARTAFSSSSSLSRIDFQYVQKRRLIMQDLSHCQGWPFGLCKKALLLPLPKSPADSWLWRQPSKV